MDTDKHVFWPDETLKHAFGHFAQPMCDRCRKYFLDFTAISRDFYYILLEGTSEKLCPNGVRDKGRIDMWLDDFLATPEAVEAKLTRAQVLCLRFYTSNSFACINNALRDIDREDEHPLPATSTCIANGSKKLRAVGADTPEAKQTVILWRGFKDTQVPSAFTKEGGTEYAPMSTTTNVCIAIDYAVKTRKTNNSLLLRIVTENALQRGASVKFLSCFPGEDEILYPPLTYMQPTGRIQVVVQDNVTLTVVEVKPTVGA